MTGAGRPLEVWRYELRVPNVSRYGKKSPEPTEWALFLVESTGMLAVCSTFRNYSFRWTHAGECFRTFLVQMDVDYVADNLRHQFGGTANRAQERELTGFMRAVWPEFVARLKADLAGEPADSRAAIASALKEKLEPVPPEDLNPNGRLSIALDNDQCAVLHAALGLYLNRPKLVDRSA